MEEKSKLQLIGEIAQANNKNLELIEEINEMIENEEKYCLEINKLKSIINKALEINKDIQEHLDKEFWIGRLELQEQILEGDKE